jgi:exopolysaccharide biosynthesis protein
VDERRACVHADGGTVTIARRPELPDEPRGDLLQAGPLLVRDGAPCVAGDPEDFAAGAGQFDSDITAGRYPRAALALGRAGRLLAVAADGRSDGDAGLTLAELAEALVALGAISALNLDGGGSTSLVCGGRLRNRPRESHGIELAGGRPVTTALTFTPR